MKSLEDVLGTTEANAIIPFSRLVKAQSQSNQKGMIVTLNLPIFICDRPTAENFARHTFNNVGITGAEIGTTDLDERTVNVVLNDAQTLSYNTLMREVHKAESFVERIKPTDVPPITR
jgi:hypothetical protein